jgi:hypothetical protein
MARLEREGLDWVNVGYHDIDPAREELPDPQIAPWDFFRAAFHAARQGNPTLLPPLLDIFLKTKDSPLAVSCADLIGDAAPDSLVDRMGELLGDDLSIDRTLLCCSALYNRSYVAYVPILLRTYVRDGERPDADIIPMWLSDMIEFTDENIYDLMLYGDSSDYVPRVMDRVAVLIERLGSERIVVWNGELFDVRTLARHMLDEVRTTHFRRELRHRFEAVTGIDCSSFYRDGKLRPLAAAAILEEFLESPLARTFEPGRPYFFGYPIA